MRIQGEGFPACLGASGGEDAMKRGGAAEMFVFLRCLSLDLLSVVFFLDLLPPFFVDLWL
jgi:hypothetical protein